VSGPLAEGVVPQLLREIYVRRRSGWLHVVRGEERQSLRFRRGHIVNARTNVVQERMGELMVRQGWLSEPDLARATEIVIRDKKRLGEVLTELGLVDASRLEDAVAFHVHEMLAKLFTWDEGEYSFEEEDEAAGGELTLKLSTGELILEAVQAVRDPDVVRYALGDMDRVLAPSGDPLLRFQKLRLSPTDGFVLSRVDGSTSAREVVQMIPLPSEDVERSLFGLLSTGVVEFVPGVRRGRAAAAPDTAAAPPADAPPPPAAAPSPQTLAPAPTPPPLSAAAPTSPAEAPPASAPAQPAAPASAAAEPPAGVESDKAAEQRREIQEAWAGLKTRNHFEVLGLARNATETDVKDAYFRLAKRFHPDVHHGSSLGDLHDQLEAVFIRLGEAYEVLREPRRRAHYEERLGRPRPAGPTTPASGTPAATAGAAPTAAPAAPDAEEDARTAEEAIWRAQKLYDKAEQLEKSESAEGGGREYWEAIQLLEPIVHKVQGKLRSKGEVMLARCYLKNPKWARRAEETLLGVTRRDPAAADAWALLGGIYAGKGMQNRALSMYRKAVELRPEHEEAAQYVASNRGTEEPAGPPREGGGLFRKLFRKP
jgi:tetratricopeptide (TPR) repeat protein